MNITELREKAKMSQKELATQLGIDASLLSRMENGSRAISQDIKDKLTVIFSDFTENLEITPKNAEIDKEFAKNTQKQEEYKSKTYEFSPRMTIAISIMNGMAGNLNIYGMEPGRLDRVVKAAFAVADKMLEVEKDKA